MIEKDNRKIMNLRWKLNKIINIKLKLGRELNMIIGFLEMHLRQRINLRRLIILKV